jgi:dehydrogenase/reductase SDR family member 1
MKNLTGQVAVVTGSSRGIGKGTAIALGEKGCTVYVTGRTIGDGDRTIDTTARLVTEAGGKGHAIQCDHGQDDQIEALFKQIGSEAGRIDILVNNVFKLPSSMTWSGNFWEHPIEIWDDQVGIGLRSHYVASWHAAKWMFKSEYARMINVSSPGGQRYHFTCSYGAGKAGLDRLTADMAIELKEKGIPACVVYPGAVSTEFIKRVSAKQGIDLTNAQSPRLVGRAITALLMSDQMMTRSGTIQWIEDLVEEFDLYDEKGFRPEKGYVGPPDRSM